MKYRHADDNFVPLPLKREDQTFVAYNVAGLEQKTHYKEAGIRLLGCFSSAEEARREITGVLDDSGPVFLSPTHQLFPLCVFHKTQTDQQAMSEIVREVTAVHASELEATDAEFRENVDHKKTGKTGLSVGYKRGQFSDASSAETKQEGGAEPVDAADRKCVSLRPRTQLVDTTQKFAVITVLPDIRPKVLQEGEKSGLEPLVAVLNMAETLEEAESFAKYTGNPAYPACNLYVVDVGRWLFPESIQSKDISREFFADDRLERLMQGKKKNTLEVEAILEKQPQMIKVTEM